MTELALRGRWLHLSGLGNARDLGGFSAGSATTCFGAVVRSDAPVLLDPAGCAQLERYGLGVFLDLRSEVEVAARPSAFACHPGYRRVPILDGAAMDRVAGLLGPAELLSFILNDQWRQLAEALRIIATAGDSGVLVHCRAGKDRAGLVSALVLANAGVGMDAIAADHAASRPPADPFISDRFPPTEASIRAVLEEVGGPSYLGAIGLREPDLAALRSRLIRPRSAVA